MLYIAIGLLLLGTLFLLTEAAIPGFGFFGVSGIILILVSSAITILYTHYGVLIVLGEIIFIFLFMYFIFKYIKKSQLYGKIILDETLNYEEKEIGGTDYFLGKEGVVKTPLKPFGTVDFNGVTIEVYSDGSYVKEKTKVKVIDVTSSKIIVRQITSN